MADPITAADVQAFLGELGYSIPGALLDPILCVVNKIIPCLDGAGYDDCTAKLILMYAAALMATSSGAIPSVVTGAAVTSTDADIRRRK